MTRFRKLNPARGQIPFRDIWHAHPIADRRGLGRRFVDALRAVIGAAVLVFFGWILVVATLLVSP